MPTDQFTAEVTPAPCGTPVAPRRAFDWLAWLRPRRCAQADASAGRIRDWLQRRNARNREQIAICDLETMSDHLLRDMGVVRDGVLNAVRHGRYY